MRWVSGGRAAMITSSTLRTWRKGETAPPMGRTLQRLLLSLPSLCTLFWLPSALAKLLVIVLVSYAVITNYHKVSSLKKRNLFPLSSGGRSPSQYCQNGQNQSVSRATFPPGSLGETLFLTFSSFWWLPSL